MYVCVCVHAPQVNRVAHHTSNVLNTMKREHIFEICSSISKDNERVQSVCFDLCLHLRMFLLLCITLALGHMTFISS